MSLPVPLSVLLSTDRGSLRVTRALRGLTFRSAVPGGFASAAFSLDRPLSISPDEIAYYATVKVSDARHGRVIWEGRLEDPGRSSGSDGQVWELAAVGSAAHPRDKTVPRTWVDQDMSRLRRSGFSTPRTSRADSTDLDSDNDTPAVDLTFAEGSTITSVAPASVVDVMYRTIHDCGQLLGRVRVDVKNGQADSNRQNRIMTRIGPNGSGVAAATAVWSTVAGSLTCSRGGGNDITSGHDVANIRVQVTAGGSVTAGVNAWGEFWGFVVRSLLKDVNGNDILTGYSADYVTTAEVVTDMIGRGDLYLVDPSTATIDTSGTAQVDELAFPTGVTPAEVLETLMVYEAAFYWALWESQPNGKYRFEWKPWPTVPRYDADVSGGFNSPGSAKGLYNQALVSWVDWRGRERTTTRTTTVAELSAAGLTRTIFVDLGSEANSLAAAQRAGDQALAEHAVAPNAGTLTVTKPILDRSAGRTIMPWEILPGNLIRVRGVLPRVDSLNVTARDGVSVFRVTAVEFDASTASAHLELDSHPLNVAQALATLARRRTRPRRAGAT